MRTMRARLRCRLALVCALIVAPAACGMPPAAFNNVPTSWHLALCARRHTQPQRHIACRVQARADGGSDQGQGTGRDRPGSASAFRAAWSKEIMDGAFMLRQGAPKDLQALTDLSVEAFQPSFAEGVLDTLQTALNLPNYRSNVEDGLRKRLGVCVSLQEAGGEISQRGASSTEGQRRGCEGQYVLLVAQDCRDGALVGMVELGVLPCPIPMERRPAPELPYLVNLAVRPCARRRGLGAELVKACHRLAKHEWGFTEMFLYVQKQNIAALSLYYSLGYVCEWQEPVWYKLKNGGQRMQRNPKMFLRKDQL